MASSKASTNDVSPRSSPAHNPRPTFSTSVDLGTNRSTATQGSRPPSPDQDELASEDLSPKSIPAPSLRRPTVPDIGSPSILDAIDAGRRASLAGTRALSMDSDSTLDHPQRGRPRGSLDSLEADISPGGAGPFYTLPESTHAHVPASTAQYTHRPSMLHTQSAAPLMGDISGANTPVSPVDNPFEDVRRSSHGSVSDEAQFTRPVPPRIQVNSSSIPSTPNPDASSDIDEAYMPSFTPEIVSRGSIAQRRISLAQGKTDRMKSMQSADSAFTTGRGSAVSGTHTPGTKTTMSQRRSARLRDTKGRKKGDKEAREIKQMNRKPFQSTRLKGEIYKPWLEEKDPAQRWARWITLVSIGLGFVIMAICECALVLNDKN